MRTNVMDADRVRRCLMLLTMLAMACCLSTAASGCAGDDPSGDAGAEKAPARDPDAPEAFLDRQRRNIYLYGRGTEFEPKPRFPSGPPPAQLVTTDLREGEGDEIERGDRVAVNYVGYRLANRKRYESSYGSDPRPIEIVPGRGNYIPGFEQGIVGMKIGGVRQIVVPADMAYGRRYKHLHAKPREPVLLLVKLERRDKQ